MKTKDELDALKQECEAMSNKLKELSDEELKVVSGGKNYDSRTIGGNYFYNHVSQTDGVIGECYYVTEDGSNNWFYGRLVRKYTEKEWFWTYHWNGFTLLTDNGAQAHGGRDVCGDSYTMYKSMMPFVDDIVK